MTRTSTPRLFRSFEKTGGYLSTDADVKIWEACRATSAATSFFDPITIGANKQKLSDGGIVHNNPIHLVYSEARQVWGSVALDNAVLMSVGTGVKSGPSLEGHVLNVIDALRELATDTEETNNRFFGEHFDMAESNRLFRFNVDQKLAEIQLHEYTETDEISRATEEYLAKADTVVKFRQWQRKLGLSTTPVNPQSLSSATPLATPFFLGRQKELEHMQNVLLSSTRGQHSVVLYGLGGFGKTQLALEFLKRHADSFETVLWIDLATTDTAIDAFKQIAILIGGQVAETFRSRPKMPPGQLFQLVGDWLKKSQRWLMVIDNVDTDISDLEFDVRHVIPKCDHGAVVVISQLSNTADNLDMIGIEVGSLDSAAGVKLLLRDASDSQLEKSTCICHHKVPILTRADLQLAQEVVESIGGVPLAIDQAAAVLTRRAGPFNKRLMWLRDALQKSYNTVLSQIPSSKASRLRWYYDKNRSIIDTFNILKIALEEESHTASSLLTNLVFFPPGEISGSMLSPVILETRSYLNLLEYEDLGPLPSSETLPWPYDGFEDEDTAQETLKLLETFCCANIRWDDDNRILGLSVHNAIRHWCQEILAEEDRERIEILTAWKMSEVIALRTNPLINRHDVSQIGHCQRLVEKYRNSGKLHNRDEALFHYYWSININLGQISRDRKDFTKAEEAFQEAVKQEISVEENLWPATFTSLRTLHLLGMAYWGDNNLEMALKTMENLFSACEKLLTLDHGFSIEVSSQISLLRTRIHGLEEASQRTQIARSVPFEVTVRKGNGVLTREPVMGEEPIEDVDDEEYRVRETFREHVNVLGDQHPDTRKAKLELINYYQDKKEYARALPILKELMELEIELKPKAHATTRLRYMYVLCLRELHTAPPIETLAERFPPLLGYAIRFNRMEQLISLLKDGFASKIGTKRATDALHDSIASCTFEVPLEAIELMINSGADVHGVGREGERSFIEIAVGHIRSARRERVANTEQSVYHPGIIQSKFRIIEVLIQHGAKIPNWDPRILIYGLQPDSADLLSKLIDWGANPDYQDLSGATVVHFAAEKNSREVMELLLTHVNASVITEKADGFGERPMSPLQIAKARGNTAVAELLEERRLSRAREIFRRLKRGKNSTASP